MKALFRQYLDKLGVQDFTQLSDEERQTYDEWVVAYEAETTVETMRKFVETQQVQLAKDLREAVQNGDDRAALYLTARLANYDDIYALIVAPDKGRQQLEAHIKNLLNHE